MAKVGLRPHTPMPQSIPTAHAAPYHLLATLPRGETPASKPKDPGSSPRRPTLMQSLGLFGISLADAARHKQCFTAQAVPYHLPAGLPHGKNQPPKPKIPGSSLRQFTVMHCLGLCRILLAQAVQDAQLARWPNG